MVVFLLNGMLVRYKLKPWESLPVAPKALSETTAFAAYTLLSIVARERGLYHFWGTDAGCWILGAKGSTNENAPQRNPLQGIPLRDWLPGLDVLRTFPVDMPRVR